jgi:hypothetical protein
MTVVATPPTFSERRTASQAMALEADVFGAAFSSREAPQFPPQVYLRAGAAVNPRLDTSGVTRPSGVPNPSSVDGGEHKIAPRTSTG